MSCKALFRFEKFSFSKFLARKTDYLFLIKLTKGQKHSSQGILSGIRGLCQGLGPALFGICFWLFDMDFMSDGGDEVHPFILKTNNHTEEFYLILKVKISRPPPTWGFQLHTHLSDLSRR
jgi:hypothetical protein